MTRNVVIPAMMFGPVCFLGGWGIARSSYPPLEVLLSSSDTVLGQEMIYPEGRAKITAAIVTMLPGEETGWHRHNAPLFAQILEGEITVDYGDRGEKTFVAGETFLEAFQSDHNGRNSGDGLVRILALFAGAEGVSNTVMRDE